MQLRNVNYHENKKTNKKHIKSPKCISEIKQEDSMELLVLYRLEICSNVLIVNKNL